MAGQFTEETLDAVDYSVSIIETYIDEMRSRDVHAAIFMYPHLPQLVAENESTFRNGDGVGHRFNRLYEESVAAYASKNGVPYRSFFDEMEKRVSDEKLYFESDMHLDPNGLRLLAHEMSVLIESNPADFLGTDLD
jgi:lysophospholipase L1-like esterase